MKKLMKKLEDLMVAITFAEAGEYDEARRHERGGDQEDAEGAFKKAALENTGK